MLTPRLSVLSAILVLLLAAGRCTAAALRRGSGSRSDGRLVDPGSAREPISRYPRTRTETDALFGHRLFDTSQHHQLQRRGRNRGSALQRERHPDPEHKEKFIRHLTGPLHFSPKCRNSFYKLYYTTRDCTIPAYYKRCARLLTRLANSPHCAEPTTPKDGLVVIKGSRAS